MRKRPHPVLLLACCFQAGGVFKRGPQEPLSYAAHRAAIFERKRSGQPPLPAGVFVVPFRLDARG